MSLPQKKVIDLTKDDDDKDSKMMALEDETKGNQWEDVLMVFDDEEEIRDMTENEFNVYLREKKNELQLFDIFVGKFLGLDWKKKGSDGLVMKAMALRKKKEYEVFLKHNKDAYASRHERMDALEELKEEIDYDWGEFIRKSTEYILKYQ